MMAVLCQASSISTIGPLHDPVTCYKITHAGEQLAQWDFQNKATRTSPPGPAYVLEVPLRNLLTSMCFCTMWPDRAKGLFLQMFSFVGKTTGCRLLDVYHLWSWLYDLPPTRLSLSKLDRGGRLRLDSCRVNIAGFHMTSLKFKLQNYWSCWYFTFMRYKSSWKLIFRRIFVPNGFLVLR